MDGDGEVFANSQRGNDSRALRRCLADNRRAPRSRPESVLASHSHTLASSQRLRYNHVNRVALRNPVHLITKLSKITYLT